MTHYTYEEACEFKENFLTNRKKLTKLEEILVLSSELPHTDHSEIRTLIDGLMIEVGVFIHVALEQGANELYFDSLLVLPMHRDLRYKMYWQRTLMWQRYIREHKKTVLTNIEVLLPQQAA